MTGTGVLRAEHRAITKMLQVASGCAAELEKGRLDEAETLLKALDFFKNFTDLCHHKKEENLLFPLLIEKGIPKGDGPVAVMLAEHVQGRNYIKEIDLALEKLKGGEVDSRYLADTIRSYVSLLENHIAKENGTLFQFAEGMLSQEEQADLYERFEQLERDEIGEGVHERYHQMIHELAEKYGVK